MSIFEHNFERKNPSYKLQNSFELVPFEKKLGAKFQYQLARVILSEIPDAKYFLVIFHLKNCV